MPLSAQQASMWLAFLLTTLACFGLLQVYAVFYEFAELSSGQGILFIVGSIVSESQESVKDVKYIDCISTQTVQMFFQVTR